MKSLTINFILKAFVIPIAISVAIIAGLFAFTPRLIGQSKSESVITMNDFDISEFDLVDYSSFSQLKPGNYVATVKSDELKINCPVVFANDENDSAAYMDTTSVEPWENGSAIIIGENINAQFKHFHDAKAGDEINVDFYSNSPYKYIISDIKYNLSIDEIRAIGGNKQILFCAQYNDFSGSDNSDLYVVYVAQQA